MASWSMRWMLAHGMAGIDDVEAAEEGSSIIVRVCDYVVRE